MGATRATVKKFLKSHKIGTLSTVTPSGVPITTPVFYIYTDIGNIRFVTKDKTTKYENIKQNSAVALSVVDHKLPIAVNVTGKANLIEDGKEIRKAFRDIGKLQVGSFMPPVIKHRKGDFVVFEIEPGRIQYTDYTKPFVGDEDNIFDL